MRKIYFISIIGVLLTLFAISPVVAMSPAPASLQSVTVLPYSSHSSYFSYVPFIHPEQGSIAMLPDMFTPVKSASAYSRFTSYIQSSTGTTQTFTESDNGKTIAATKGQVVKVRLKENPTTGYRWEPSVSSGIRISDDSYEAPVSGAMGAGGVHTWTLIITSSGDQQFSADYKRSWETGSAYSYTIKFIVA